MVATTTIDTTIQARDGRALTFRDWGDVSGRPVFYLHGAPGSRLLRGPDVDSTGLGIRLITYDRPGYGRSQRQPGRTVGDAVSDILDIADHLKVESFGVVGVSGGGAPALAVAAVAAERVIRCTTVCGIGPADADGLEFFAGMDPAEVTEWQDITGADVDRDRVLADVREWIEGIQQNPQLPDEVKARMVAAFTEGVRTGADGIVDDYLALSRPWGFDLADVTCPTTVMVAEDDTSVPPAHGRWLAAHLPPPGLLLVPGGHIDARDDLLTNLIVWTSGQG
jgi:pimeloyl-ACP methyl ester carboxylesterase